MESETKVCGNVPSSWRGWLELTDCLAILAMLVGFFGFGFCFACMLIGWRSPATGRYVEFPVGDPSDVISDSRGRIFVGSGCYGRIQVYNNQGRFLHGFFVKARGGPYRLRINDNGALEVATARGEKVYVLSEHGTVAVERPDKDDLFHRLSSERANGFVDDKGRRYLIRNALVFCSIVRMEPTGAVSLTIRSPFYYWPIDGPGASLLTVSLAYACRYLIRRWQTRHP